MSEIIENINQGMELGKIFAESGMFPDIKSASQGYIKILAGREVGMSPMQSLNSFYFVSGRIGITSNAAASLVKHRKQYDYIVKSHTNEECVITFLKLINGEEKIIGESIFTFKDAARAGLANKDNWKNYPKNMLFARALMNGIRWYCPETLSSFTYAVEELDDLSLSKADVVTINQDGTVEMKVASGESNETTVQ